MDDGHARMIANELRTLNQTMRDILSALRNIRDRQR
jgi:hypothetical protein